jgi:hypothetical protein
MYSDLLGAGGHGAKVFNQQWYDASLVLSSWSLQKYTTHFFVQYSVIAWAIGMVSLGAISLGSFQTGAVLLAGLFCYDVFWVFGSDVMMTVATKGN